MKGLARSSLERASIVNFSQKLVSLSLLALFASVNVLKSETQLMPGLTYYHGKEKLSGKLVFHVWKSDSRAANSDTAAAIHELDLSDGRLRKVAECPKGILVPDRNGDARCIISWIDDGIQSMQEKETKAFILSSLTPQPRRLGLAGSPRVTVVTGGHVFFQLDIGNRSSLLDYDILRDRKGIVEFTDASRWKYEKYDRIHAPRGHGGKRMRFIFSTRVTGIGSGRSVTTDLVSTIWIFRVAMSGGSPS